MSHENPTVDQVSPEATSSSSQLEENLKSRSTWMRLVFMLVFYVIVSLASVVGTAVIVLGFFWLLFTGEVNRQLQQAGQSVACYIYEIVRYLTLNTEERPFPFGGDWPAAETKD